MITRAFAVGTFVALQLVLASSLPSYAQQAGAESATPGAMPPEIANMIGAAGGGEVSIAAPSEPLEGSQPNVPAATAASRYLFTTLRVVNNGNPRGCSYANWGCMTNLCKSDLHDNTAWRGWAGCWKSGSNYICYFECGQTRNAF